MLDSFLLLSPSHCLPYLFTLFNSEVVRFLFFRSEKTGSQSQEANFEHVCFLSPHLLLLFEVGKLGVRDVLLLPHRFDANQDSLVFSILQRPNFVVNTWTMDVSPHLLHFTAELDGCLTVR